MSLIETNDLHKTYHTGELDTPVLHGINLSIAPGEFVALMGPSGCGKSTLLYVLGLLAGYDRGTVRIGGRDATSLSRGQKTRIRREEMAFVFQRFNLLPALSARDNVAMTLQLRGQRADGEVTELLGRVGLEGKEHHRPSALSIGEQQRVAIARSLVGRPAILFADEPTGNLDTANSRHVLEILRQCNRDLGQTILMVTHDDEAAGWADRTVTMRDGRIVDD